MKRDPYTIPLSWGNELIIDNFAGGGGTSTGLEQAFGRHVDIGLRMLSPRELFRAQGFPGTYIIGDDPAQGLTLTKTAQVRMCGNSVCPPMAFALIQANFKHEQKFSRVA